MTNIKNECCSLKNQEPLNDAAVPKPVKKNKPDIILYGSILSLITAILISYIFPAAPNWIHIFSKTSIEILLSMWWGVALGIFIIGLMSYIPREYFIGLMGKDNSLSGLFRAVFAGLFLDLCCHGILLVAAKLYERGVSTAQVMTFLIASPWNSVSLTLVLITLIGLKWTILYILGSIIIALLSGLLFQILTRCAIIPANTNIVDMPQDFSLWHETKTQLKRVRINKANLLNIIINGWDDGKMIIKWLLFGTLIAASTRAFIPHDTFSDWFGPTLLGLLFTVLIATVIEICSEGSAPVASEFVTQAGAPGNGFAFLMAGVATDYTEILAIKQFTGSWKVALMLPIITVPQVIFISWLMNAAVTP